MSRNVRRNRAWAAYIVLFILALIPAFLVPAVRGQEGEAGAAPAAVKLSEESEACMACHSGEMEEAPKVNLSSHQKSPHAEQDCQSCHAEYTPDYPHTPAMKASRVDCATCHSDVQEELAASVHNRPNKDPGDHPTCQSCHILTKDPHFIQQISERPRTDRAELCSSCHSNKPMMERYGLDPAAVSSYHASFHGKALLKFGYRDAAECVDCHGSHKVLKADDPAAPTHPNNRAAMCAKCHEGANVNFAMSGANHLELRLKTSPFLFVIFWFFRILVFGMLVVLMLGVALDLRRRVFGPHPPASGRLPAIFIALSFILMALTLLMATFDWGHTQWVWVASLVFMALAFLVYFITRPRNGRHTNGQPRFKRLSLVLRLQHGVMAIAFTLLAATGLPQRFSGSAILSQVPALFGGFQNARLLHRGAALVLITVWVWHLLWLLYRWAKAGFSFKSWTMLPNKKDLADVIQLAKFHLHLSHEEPKWDRFQFKGKMDYFAEYWGMPVMVVTGFILWFPIFWGNRLPNEAVSLAIIAHSYEATLAFLSIVTWHMYNAHFNPEHFPMNPTWLTGEMTREAMQHEHPLELERIESGEKPAEQAEAGGPIPPKEEPPRS